MDILKSAQEILLELIFPSGIKCMACGCAIPRGNTYSLCKACFNGISFIKKGCEKCGKPIPEALQAGLCPSCEASSEGLIFDRAICGMEYSDTVHRLIYSFKYGRRTYMAKPLARILSDKIEYEQMEFEIIVPVPLSKARFRQRGFNQSKLLGDEISAISKMPCVEILERTRDTRFLSGLSRHERKKELKDVFTLKPDSHNIINNKKVLVVDDIMTTGTTLSEIAGIIKKSGAEKVYAACLATGRNIY